MPKGPMSDHNFARTASLAQKSAYEKPLLQKTVGSDPEISDSIVLLHMITDEKKITLLHNDPLQWVIELLDGLRISHFATSEKTDIISKLGFFLPTKDLRVIDE